MVRHTLKILQQMLQDFQSVSEDFGTLCIKVLKVYLFQNGNFILVLIFVKILVWMKNKSFLNFQIM